ncbi:hypothetical protein ACFL0P_00335 [Candidatus Omnitrophota bacterium]
MGPVEALKLALSQEKQAIEMYRDFSVKYPAAKDTFTFLVVEEEKHKNLLEKKISELTRY